MLSLEGPTRVLTTEVRSHLGFASSIPARAISFAKRQIAAEEEQTSIRASGSKAALAREEDAESAPNISNFDS